MKQQRIEIAVEPQPDEVEFVIRQIVNFNRSRAGEGNYNQWSVMPNQEF